MRNSEELNMPRGKTLPTTTPVGGGKSSVLTPKFVLRFESVGPEFTYAAVGADHKGQRVCVPVLIGVQRFACRRLQGMPVAAIVGGDVGAVGAYGNPEFLLGVVGYGTPVAMGWGGRL